MTDLTRREVLQTAALGVAMFATTEAAAQQVAEPTGPAWTRTLEPKGLPFDPKSLNGLSQKLIQSHWENNYVGAVKALNVVREKLRAQLTSQDPPYIYNGLKREHLIRTGSVVLHELYFGNLGGDGKPSAELRSNIAKSFGSFTAWESEFRKIAQGLSGGSGWVVLGYNQHLQLLENYWQADHAHNPPHTQPVLVMDMYEHAYHLDFGAAAGKYIDAFFANINWDEVGGRYQV
ncbi:superoxide dismutase [Steroidobacter cummioxidans]|uniref:superoxide dismutase n=1 Tax=Steroidobacter cummioxidans TaxID=1803913 RepID=UPI000E322680|nr:Fe-Mn family superoxide dismutase [Steroidobacter cummioxidans]